MAKSKTSDIVKITISARGIPDVDPVTNQPTGTFRNILKNNITDLRSFERVIQSSVNESFHFSEELRSVDPNSGLPEQSLFIKKEDLKNVYGTLRSKSAELSSKRGGAYVIEVHSAEELKATKTIYGKDAQKKAIEELYRKGGKAEVSTSDPDKLNITLPYEKSALVGMSQKQKRALIEKAIPEAMKLSDDERDTRKKEEEDKKIKEQEKRTANELKLIKEQDIAKAKARKEADKLIEDANKKAEADRKKKDKERKKKATAIIKSILAVVTVIGDLVRRILTSTLKQASENNKMAVEAHSVGMTAMQRRGLDIFDIAHGMEKGTTFGAIQSVQGMFGNITSLDEKALATLARVMGNEIGDLVRSGIGGQNPDKLLDKILDKYFKQFLSGRNSLGQSVGVEQARRELITSLQSVSPEIAKLFARMADDYTSGYYKPFGDSAGWRATTKVNRSGLQEVEYNYSTELGKKYNEILAIVDDLKTSFFTKLSIEMDDILVRVKNMRIGQSNRNKIEEDTLNKQRNEESKKAIERQLAFYNESTRETVKDLSSTERTPISKYIRSVVSEEQANRFKYSIEQLAGIYSGQYNEAYFKDNLSGTGMKSNKEITAYLARGREVFENAMFNKDIVDELAKAYVIIDFIKKIRDTNKNLIGSGDIADLSITDNAINALAMERIDFWGNLVAPRSEKFDELSSERRAVFALGFKNYLLSNPDELNKLRAKSGNKVGKNLSLDEEIEAYVELYLEDWFTKNFFSGTTQGAYNYVFTHGSAKDTFVKDVSVDMAKSVLASGESRIIPKLIYDDIKFEPNKTYSISGSKGQSGEYLVKIQVVDSKGTPQGAPKEITWSNFGVNNATSMKIITNSRGEIIGTEQ